MSPEAVPAYDVDVLVGKAAREAGSLLQVLLDSGDVFVLGFRMAGEVWHDTYPHDYSDTGAGRSGGTVCNCVWTCAPDDKQIGS